MGIIRERFPSADAVLQADSSDLGIAILREIVSLNGSRDAWTRPDRQPQWRPITALTDLVASESVEIPAVRAAAGDAIAWLTAHGLIAEYHSRGGGSNPRGPMVATRLGEQVAAASANGAGGIALAMRAVDLIPVASRSRIVPPLVAGDFDLAIAGAFKAVEVRMRERANLSSHVSGQVLITNFFKAISGTRRQRKDRKGDLADEEHLFRGLFGMYRNRAVHEAPHVDDPQDALEIIISALHLLRIVESAELDPV